MSGVSDNVSMLTRYPHQNIWSPGVYRVQSLVKNRLSYQFCAIVVFMGRFRLDDSSQR